MSDTTHGEAKRWFSSNMASVLMSHLKDMAIIRGSSCVQTDIIYIVHEPRKDACLQLCADGHLMKGVDKAVLPATTSMKRRPTFYPYHQIRSQQPDQL